MAIQSKKQSSRKSQSTSASKPKKVKPSASIKKAKNTYKSKRIFWIILLATTALVAMGGFGYYFDNSGYTGSNTERRTAKISSHPSNIQKHSNEYLPSKPKQTTKTENKTKPANIQPPIKTNTTQTYPQGVLSNPPPEAKKAELMPTQIPAVVRGKKARLVVIIDDVATPKQLQTIASIPLKITPSIFPPSSDAPHTVKMSQSLKHFMIHLPMQAKGGAMPDTLKIGDTDSTMRQRVANMRRWFPHAIYTNNHTGSRFTSDYDAMYKLYGILKEEGFVFVDSRTSARTQGRSVAHAYGDFYLARDVFIDNTPNFSAIRTQLKEAVRKAQNRGYAIAIGHPYPVTMSTLRNSMDILSGVDVVYIDELMVK
jgi:polysaccharide deacetylase 2 family uncharacterized protein YibQ